jgi:hypothetical protein
MEISRGGKQRQWTNGMEHTDSKAPSQYVNEWKYRGGGGPYGRFEGGNILFNGTKTRDPERAAELQVRISDDDVCALFTALLERKSEDEQRLREAMCEIDDLLQKSNFTSESDEISNVVGKVQTLVRDALCPDQQAVWDGGIGRSKLLTRRSEAPNWNPFRKAVLEP